MYTATMEYQFKPGCLQQALEIWKKLVLPAAQGREGLHRMILLTQGNDRILAMGIWSDKPYAEEFMKTGIFKTLMEHLEGLLVKDPEPRFWTLEAEL